jgi:hypothetical protein
MNQVPLYLGHEHECPYLPGQTARMAFMPPDLPLSQSGFSLLVANGFRRSGDLVYRTYCESCAACVPVRISVADFQPNRAQRRIARGNAALRIIEKPAEMSALKVPAFSNFARITTCWPSRWLTCWITAFRRCTPFTRPMRKAGAWVHLPFSGRFRRLNGEGWVGFTWDFG